MQGTKEDKKKYTIISY